MEYREFAEYINDNLSAYLKYAGKIKIRLIDGNTPDNIILAVSTKKDGFFHIISVTEHYEKLQNGGDLEAVMKEIAEDTEKNLMIMGNVRRKDVEDWEKIRDNIIPKLIVPGSGFYRPDILPHRKVADLIAIYLIAVQGKKNIKYAPVTYSMCDQYADDYGISAADIEAAAMENLKRSGHYFGPVKETAGEEFRKKCAEKGFDDIYTVSAPESLIAPEIMLDEEKLDEYAGIIGGDYRIYPYSMSNMFLVSSASGKEEYDNGVFTEFLKENPVSGAETFITDRFYLYDSAKKEIMPGGSWTAP